MIKKLFLSAVFSAVSVFAMAQVQNVTHVVQRGETIESIAKYYHVSVDDINKANPNADGMVYVGMKLVVPVKNQAQEIVSGTQVENAVSVSNETKPSDSSLAMESHQDTPSVSNDTETPWAFTFEIGYGFIKGSSNYQYEATIGANYHLPFNLYAGARIGYNGANYNVSGTDDEGHSATLETQYHFIEIPVELGYALATPNKNWAIVPFVGINANIGLTGKSKYKTLGSGGEKYEGKEKIGGKIGFEAKLGIRLRLAGFNISGSYHMPLNDKQKGWFGKDAYPEISIGFGF